jgi:hypothetical protein
MDSYSRYVSDSLTMLTVDPHPPPKKVKKRWDRFEEPSKDPNWGSNIIRARHGLPPRDRWNIGVEYTWDGKISLFLMNLITLEKDLY